MSSITCEYSRYGQCIVLEARCNVATGGHGECHVRWKARAARAEARVGELEGQLEMSMATSKQLERERNEALTQLSALSARWEGVREWAQSLNIKQNTVGSYYRGADDVRQTLLRKLDTPQPARPDCETCEHWEAYRGRGGPCFDCAQPARPGDGGGECAICHESVEEHERTGVPVVPRLSPADEKKMCGGCDYWESFGGDRGHCSWLSEKTFESEHKCADDHWTPRKNEP